MVAMYFRNIGNEGHSSEWGQPTATLFGPISVGGEISV